MNAKQIRCLWSQGDPLMQRYHDEEWGVPDFDSRSLWETLMLEGFQAVAARHQHALERLRNARQILFRGNVGLVRFEREDQKVTAVHEVYTSFSDPGQPTPQITKPEAFLVQVARLGPEPEDRPERLREKAIEIPRLGTA